MKILVSGSLAFDKILDFPGRFSEHILPDRTHDLNVSFVTDNLSENFGGTAGNIAYNLALLGLIPVVFSSAGNDFQPYQYWLDTKGVKLGLVRIVENVPTAFATIMTDRKDNQITALYLGAMNYPCNLPDDAVPQVKFGVVSAGNLNDMGRMIGLHRKRKTPFMFDPGQQTTSLSSEQLVNGMDGAEVFISNDYELSMVTDKTGLDTPQILQKSKMVVTTLGENGSRITTAKGTIDIPVAKVEEVKDPTGAGDAYRAGFIAGLLKKWPLEVSGRFAAVVAAYAVEGTGPQAHEFSFHSARARYAENFKKELPS